MAWSWRTIFLLVRGIDQTGRAFAGPMRKLDALQKKQRALARSSYRLLFAGAAFIAFGAMMTKALAPLIETTTMGSLLMDDLRRAWGRFTTAVGEQMTKILEPAFKSLIKWLDNISKNPFWTKAAGWAAVGIPALIIGFGLKSIAGSLITRFAGGAAGGLLGGLLGGILTKPAAPALPALYEAVVTGAAGGFAPTAATIGPAGGGLISTITGAITAVAPVAVPIILATALAVGGWKIWNYFQKDRDEQIDMMIRAGEKQEAWRRKLGISDEQWYSRQNWGYYSPEMYGMGDVYVDIYGNTWDRDVDEAELGRNLGYNILEETTNQLGYTPTLP